MLSRSLALILKIVHTVCGVRRIKSIVHVLIMTACNCHVCLSLARMTVRDSALGIRFRFVVIRRILNTEWRCSVTKMHTIHQILNDSVHIVFMQVVCSWVQVWILH